MTGHSSAATSGMGARKQLKPTTRRRLKPISTQSKTLIPPEKPMLMERTFRFKNLSEFATLYNQERLRILKLKKEFDEYNNQW